MDAAAVEFPLSASGLALVLAERFNASSLADVRAGPAETPEGLSPTGFVTRLGATIRDLGLSARIAFSPCGLRAIDVDCVRVWPRLGGCVAAAGTPGRRRECERPRPADSGGFMAVSVERTFWEDVTVSSSVRMVCCAELGWYNERGRSRPCLELCMELCCVDED